MIGPGTIFLLIYPDLQRFKQLNIKQMPRRRIIYAVLVDFYTAPNSDVFHENKNVENRDYNQNKLQPESPVHLNTHFCIVCLGKRSKCAMFELWALFRHVYGSFDKFNFRGIFPRNCQT